MFANTQGGGTNFAAPDVCKTPTPGGPVPIPYPNFSFGKNGRAGTISKKVLIVSHPAHTLKTVIGTSSGDEPGSVGGVVSGVHRNITKWSAGYPKVVIENMPCVRHTDVTLQNGSTPNIAGSTIVPSQVRVNVG